ncbi:MAG: hypothetical protein GY950_03385 [bacterium]|nr:hypothetical protein [bacterium]
MTDKPLYKIIFDGKINAGEDFGQVKARLASLFKVDFPVIEKAFRDAPTIIQRNLSEEKALKYKEAIERNGALCRIEKEIPPPAPQSLYTPPPQTTTYTTVTTAAEPVKNIETGSAHAAHLDRKAWNAMAIGLGIAVVTLFFPFLSFVFRYLITLVHEIGHAIWGWLFGYPSIPAFDFTYGGGVTMHQDRRIIIVIVVFILFAWLFYLYRKNRLTFVLLLVITALYSLSTFTPFHSMVILFMGHGTELIFGAVFFYRALSGSSIVVDAERPLYGFLGFFIFFSDTGFAYRLMTSKSFRVDYESAKGGGHWMDFSRLAEEYLNVNLSTVAAFFLFLCLLTPVLTYLFFRYRENLFHFFYRVLTPEPGNG